MIRNGILIFLISGGVASGASEVVIQAGDTCSQEKVNACLGKDAPEGCATLLGLVCAEAGVKLAQAGEETRAAAFLVRACRLGVGATCVVLGEERLAKKDRDAAMVFFTQACLSGSESGCAKLKNQAQSGAESGRAHTPEQPLNPVASAWLDTNMGIPPEETGAACAELSIEECFQKGENLRSENPDVARKTFRAGCDKDHAPACNRLGWMLTKAGRDDEAGPMLKKACRLGEAKACNNLGWQAEKDHRQDDARRWYRSACDLGHSKACDRLSLVAP